MGIQKEQFNKIAFQELPWQTRDLRTVFLESLAEQGICVQLQRTLKDIDQQQDVVWFYKRLQQVSETFKSILLNSIQKIQSVISYLTFDIATFYTKLLFNKGSPSHR